MPFAIEHHAICRLNDYPGSFNKILELKNEGALFMRIVLWLQVLTLIKLA